jgi:hypothetical protein
VLEANRETCVEVVENSSVVETGFLSNLDHARDVELGVRHEVIGKVEVGRGERRR